MQTPAQPPPTPRLLSHLRLLIVLLLLLLLMILLRLLPLLLLRLLLLLFALPPDHGTTAVATAWFRFILSLSQQNHSHPSFPRFFPHVPAGAAEV